MPTMAPARLHKTTFLLLALHHTGGTPCFSAVAKDYEKLFGEKLTYKQGLRLLETLKDEMTAETGFKFDMKKRGWWGRKKIREDGANAQGAPGAKWVKREDEH
jgi:hypothetical protein